MTDERILTLFFDELKDDRNEDEYIDKYETAMTVGVLDLHADQCLQRPGSPQLPHSPPCSSPTGACLNLPPFLKTAGAKSFKR